jgi:hypothetical protein
MKGGVGEENLTQFKHTFTSVGKGIATFPSEFSLWELKPIYWDKNANKK